MKIDFGATLFDVKKGWFGPDHRPDYAVRAQHPEWPHITGHGVGEDRTSAKAAALKNLRTLILRKIEDDHS